MLSLKDYELPNKSILKNIQKGSKINWIFIAGGPGLGEEYLVNFLEKYKFSNNSIHVYCFPKFNSTLSDKKIFDNLNEDIEHAINNLENVILVGHSFGGMLLQVCKNLNYKKLILLSSSPNLKCFEHASKSFDNFSQNQKDQILDIQSIYEKNKNNVNFKEMYRAWAPYYVSHTSIKDYLSILNLCHFEFEYHEWGARFFYNYFNENCILKSQTICINSRDDKICPSSLFLELKIPELNIIELDSNSHFPWIENTQLVLNALTRFDLAIDSLN